MSTENKIQPIQNLTPGDQITTFYIVRKVDLKTRKDGVPYLHMEFGDSTGRITAMVWNDAQEIFGQIKVGQIAKIMGHVNEYRNNRQINIEKIRAASSEDNIKVEDFLPQGDFDIDELMQQFEDVLSSITNPHLKLLLDKLFSQEGVKEKYFKAPGGKLWHHAYVGGLLQHTLAIIGICETAVKYHPACDRDLVIAGALLHDIGKLDEYRCDQGFFDFTDEGRLWGHISIGGQMIRKLIEEIEEESEFPSDLKKKLIHLILSHQGELDHGSPVVPMIPEAMILYYADEMDSKVNALEHIVKRESGEGNHWSKFVNLIDRFIYLGED